MKKVVLSCVISFLILMINQCSFATTATVNIEAVRVRESASTNSNIITVVYEDDEVEILEENEGWYKLKYEDKIGFAKAEFFVKKEKSEENKTQNKAVAQNETPKETVANTAQTPEQSDIVPNENEQAMAQQEWKIGENIVLPSTVKLRNLPNLAINSKIEITQGTNITIEAKLGNWYKITNQTISGWVTKSKLSQETVMAEQTPVVNNPPVNTKPKEPKTPENTAPTQTVVPEQPAEKQPEQLKQEPKQETNKTAVVIVETARVRKKASTSSDIVEVLDEGDVVTITGEENNFYQITSEKVNSGYVSKSLLKQKEVSSRSMTEERENEASSQVNNEVKQDLLPQENTKLKASDIAKFAKQFLGYPYKLGASSPEKGFDCSGFTRYVFGYFGFSLGQVAASQTSLGTIVERPNLQIGDLILFYDEAKSKIGHCGIFMGNGDFIHSANPQRGVVMDNLNSNSYYAERFVTARRIVE